jgi:FkbM family methyltransferase
MPIRHVVHTIRFNVSPTSLAPYGYRPSGNLSGPSGQSGPRGQKGAEYEFIFEENAMEPNADVDPLAALLIEQGIEPVLVDIGASGNVHSTWQRLAKISVGIGFDPDARDLPPQFQSAYRRAILVPKIIVGRGSAGFQTTPFYLTAFPACSSSLLPNTALLDQYVFRDLFDIHQTIEVPAGILPDLLQAEGIDHIDWLKLDTQGTDLRILQSLSSEWLDRLSVIEVEPGYDTFYQGEDTFHQIHAWLLDHGFWLARMTNQAYPRVSVEVANRLGLATAPSPHLGHDALGRSPTASECVYLRDWRTTIGKPDAARHLLIIAASALCLELPGHSAQIADRLDSLAQAKTLAQALSLMSRQAFETRLRAFLRPRLRRLAGRVLPSGIKNAIKRLLST